MTALDHSASQRRPAREPADPPALPSDRDVLSQAATENFPVALRVLPSRYRRHLTAIYGYARLVDDVGDELAGGPEERLAALDALETELDQALAGRATHPIFLRLQETISDCGLERRPLADLIEANRMDQRVTTYETFDQLTVYCQLSANPVGRLVLSVFGAAGEDRERHSDLVCTGLQLVEHFQDVAEDAANGRTYIPAEDLDRFSVERGELYPLPGAQTPASPAFRRLMAFEVTRARTMLDEGSRLVELVDGWGRIAIAGFVAGGLAQVEAIERASYDVLASPVKAPRRAIAAHASRLCVRARSRSRGRHRSRSRDPGPGTARPKRSTRP